MLTTIVLSETLAGMETRMADWKQVIFPPLRHFVESERRFSAVDLVRASWLRDELMRTLAPVFERFDALLTPQMPVTALPNGQFHTPQIAGQDVDPTAFIAFTFPFNLSGQPAASLPVGFDSGGLPIGLQLVGRRFGEATLFRLAAAYEAAYPWERPSDDA